jgi:hypothetical protein
MQPAQPRASCGPLTSAALLSPLFHCRVGPIRQLPSLILFSSLRLTPPSAGQPSRPGAPPVQPDQRAGRGAAGLPGWHARQGPVRAGREAAGEKVKGNFAPPAGIQGASGCSPGAPPALPGGGAKGTVDLSPSRPRGADSKGEEAVWVGGKANHPSWGFLYLCSAACPEWKEKAGAPLPRRAVGGRSRRPCCCVALGEGGAEDRTGSQEPGAAGARTTTSSQGRSATPT